MNSNENGLCLIIKSESQLQAKTFRSVVARNRSHAVEASTMGSSIDVLRAAQPRRGASRAWLSHLWSR